MKKRLGPGHLKTLECASLNALLLALNSQTRAAETACIATHEAMTTELGPEHPYTLEAMGHLVQIYQMQSRFLEAVDTANSLAKIVSSAPTETRPQILHSRCIRAESELKMGNYATAELELGDVTKVAQASFKDNRLENLHYQSTLALAYNHCAKNEQAEDLAGRVLRKQLKIYTTRHGHGERGFNEEKVAEEDMTSQIAMIINIASLEPLHSIIEKLIDQGFILTLRPPVLETLWVIALILQQKEDPASLELAIRLLQALWDRFVQGGQVESQDALRVRYDLALAIRRKAEAETSHENGDKRLGESAEHLRNVYRSRSQVLGHENPETLSARLELIITNCTLGRWEEMLSLAEVSEREKLEKSPEQVDFFSSSSLDQKSWTLVQSESRKIADLHEAKLGENHPETLKSLLWVLAVQALLGDIATATKTSEKILRRLKMVRTQRLVESIHLERKLALVVVVFDRHWADIILRGTRETIQEKRDFMPETWQMLDKMINGELSRLEHMSR
ncbi:hypothetical protein PFICI_03991 [Pestalotiopsis fici W106-1]|uniref:MalT-like TPR region domain-containing protein n=1 Tax=Pestalotiopsis fici (strain W106-1 / CGMCC3.15140) TaxID=1229662 RepID=W3XL33_PESFW|nr:uncharacterized protein PFICI_03991 [Pestalotiopsis fici W106-1]ETS85966.1 hypothetical protein PFICI_03991 [Pestalotiopsis fici W106-1]